MSPLHRIREGFKNIGELSETLTDIPGEVLGLLQQVKDGNLKVSDEIKGLPEMKKAMDRLVLALIISALSIGSAILVLANMPPKIFGVTDLEASAKWNEKVLGLKQRTIDSWQNRQEQLFGGYDLLLIVICKMKKIWQL